MKKQFPYAGFKLYVNGAFKRLYTGTQRGFDAAYEAIANLPAGKIGWVQRIPKS